MRCPLKLLILQPARTVLHTKQRTVLLSSQNPFVHLFPCGHVSLPVRGVRKGWGIELASIDEPITDDTAAGKLARNMIASVNQFFSDSLSEKTKDRMKAGVKQGRWLWVAPLGYKNDIGTKTVIIDQERAPLVRKVF